MPHCAEIEGVIKYYPILKESIEIIYVDFKRPRQEIILLIREYNQGCPNLIIDKNDFENDEIETGYFKTFGKYLFVNSNYSITKYLSNRFGIGIPHP